MSYSGIGNLRQRMATLLAEAKSHGHQIQDMIPEELQDDFCGLKELKRAKSFIKEGEEREKSLQQQLDDSTKELIAAKNAVEDLPEDYKQLKIDHGQLQHQVEFYQKLKEDAETQSRTYQQKWLRVLKKQAQDNDQEAKIEALESQCAQQQALLTKLVDENHNATEIFDILRDQHFNALEKKEGRLMEMEKAIEAAQAHSKSVEEESENFEALYNDLVQRLENENGDCAAALNKAAERIRTMEMQNNAAVSEAVILRKFHEHCLSGMRIYQRIFGLLLNSDQQKVFWLPDALETHLQLAGEEREAFLEMESAFEFEGIEQNGVLEELYGIYVHENLMLESLQLIRDDLSQFLVALPHNPDLGPRMRRSFGMFARK